MISKAWSWTKLGVFKIVFLATFSPISHDPISVPSWNFGKYSSFPRETFSENSKKLEESFLEIEKLQDTLGSCFLSLLISLSCYISSDRASKELQNDAKFKSLWCRIFLLYVLKCNWNHQKTSDHKFQNNWRMRPKLDVVKFLYRCLTLIKFEGNLEGVWFFCVDLTWNGNLLCFLMWF